MAKKKKGRKIPPQVANRAQPAYLRRAGESLDEPPPAGPLSEAGRDPPAGLPQNPGGRPYRLMGDDHLFEPGLLETPPEPVRVGRVVAQGGLWQPQVVFNGSHQSGCNSAGQGKA